MLRAEIDLGTSGKAPSEIRLLRAGVNESDYGPFLFDELSAAMVIGSFQADGKPRLYGDWNHGMLDPDAGREKGAAACSFVPEVRNGELFASDIKWTEDGANDVETRRYNYFSPAFTYEYGEDGQCRPRKLINFALVNRAGLKDIEPLLAASAAHHEENTVDEKLETELRSRIETLETENKTLRGVSSDVVALSAAVGLAANVPNAERVTAISGLVALRADVLKVTGQETPAGALGVVSAWKAKAEGYDKLAKESEEAQVVALRAEMTGILDNGAKEGRVTGAPGATGTTRALAEEAALKIGGGKPTKEGVAWLSAFVGTMPKAVAMVAEGAAQPAAGTSGVVALSADDKELAKRHGMSETAMLKAKQDLEEQRARREGARA